jgi:hypothetical protein
MIKNDKLKHVHVHVPKTGGTSLTEMLKEQGWKLEGYHRKLIELKSDSNKYKDYYKTVIIRNPWEHAVSFYIYLLFKKHFNILDFVSEEDRQSTGDNICLEDVSFKNYIKRTHIKKHYQSLFTEECTEKGLVFDKWFDYSNFDSMLTFFNNKYDITINRNIREQDKRTHCKVIDIDDNKPYQDYYCDETYALVRDVSLSEIERFDYKIK